MTSSETKYCFFTYVMKSRHLILVNFFFGQQKFKCCVLIFYFFLPKPLRDSLKSLKKKKKKKSEWYWTPNMELQVLHFTLYIATEEFFLHKNSWGRNPVMISWYWFFTCVTKHNNTHIHTLKKHWGKQSWLCVDYWLIREADFTVKSQLKIRKTLPLL